MLWQYGSLLYRTHVNLNAVVNSFRGARILESEEKVSHMRQALWVTFPIVTANRLEISPVIVLLLEGDSRSTSSYALTLQHISGTEKIRIF